MVGVVVGVLVRHLEDADRLLDPYLAEPTIWQHEFGRLVHENSGLAATSRASSRRNAAVVPREAAMLLVLRADDTRADELRTIGQRLVETARRLIVERSATTATRQRSTATRHGAGMGERPRSSHVRSAPGGKRRVRSKRAA